MRRAALYAIEDLHFAYVYHVYLRWHTHYRRPVAQLRALGRDEAEEVCSAYGIHLLELNASDLEACFLVSLEPTETVSACASKLKGQLSKRMRQSSDMPEPTKVFGRGYFACTSGKSRTEAVNDYLAAQGEHHGYAHRVSPPVFQETYRLSAQELVRLRPKHAWTVLDFHIVLATCERYGAFGTAEAEVVAQAWRASAEGGRFCLRKVSFVPDHVHVAVRAHPELAPAAIAAALMNRGQEALQEHSRGAVRGKRLWQPSAYIGSFGDLATPQIQKYIQNWRVGVDP